MDRYAIRASLATAKNQIRQQTSKSFWLRYSTLAAYRTVCAGLIALTGRTWSGTHSAVNSVEESVKHVEWVYGVLSSSAGVKQFYGKAAEVGPGESCALALMLLAHGCSQVDLADRFNALGNSGRQAELNSAIVSRYPQLAALRKDDGFSESTFPITRYTGKMASAENFFLAHTGYDFIVSAAVLEHASDPLLAVSRMGMALNPGGLMIHGIDFRDHGQFCEFFDELSFLRLPEPLYAPLRWRGGPNRVRISAYLQRLSQMGLEVFMLPCSVAGTKEQFQPVPVTDIPEEPRARAREIVRKQRSAFARRFRQLDELDLMVTTAMLIARKPLSSDGRNGNFPGSL